MHRIDSNGATVDHKFTDTPISGQNATVVDDDWLNAVQEELCNFLENFGVTLTKGTNTQLSTLMGSLLAASALLTKIKNIPRTDAALDVDLLDGLHASAFATAVQGAKADIALSTTRNETLINMTEDVNYAIPSGTWMVCVNGGNSPGCSAIIEAYSSYPIWRTIAKGWCDSSGSNAIASAQITSDGTNYRVRTHGSTGGGSTAILLAKV